MPMLGEEILARAAELAAQAAGVSDYRLIDYKAKGVLATAVRSLVESLPVAVVVSTSVSGSDVLLEVLTPYAQRVVRAMRG